MALSDSQTVKVGTTDVVLARTGMTLTEGSFASPDRKYGLTVKHSFGGRLRHVVQLKLDDIVENPLVNDRNMPVSAHAHIVVDFPANGVASATAVNIAKAIATWATEANLLKVVNGES